MSNDACLLWITETDLHYSVTGTAMTLDFLLWLEIKSFTRAAYIVKRLHGIAEIKD